MHQSSSQDAGWNKAKPDKFNANHSLLADHFAPYELIVDKLSGYERPTT